MLTLEQIVLARYSLRFSKYHRVEQLAASVFIIYYSTTKIEAGIVTIFRGNKTIDG
jgi:hypothetical protein